MACARLHVWVWSLFITLNLVLSDALFGHVSGRNCVWLYFSIYVNKYLWVSTNPTWLCPPIFCHGFEPVVTMDSSLFLIEKLNNKTVDYHDKLPWKPTCSLLWMKQRSFTLRSLENSLLSLRPDSTRTTEKDDLCRITLNSRACISRTCESPNLVTSHSFVCFAVTLKQLPEELVRFRILRLDGQILRNMSAIEVCERETSAHPRGTRHQTNQQEHRDQPTF